MRVDGSMTTVGDDDVEEDKSGLVGEVEGEQEE